MTNPTVPEEFTGATHADVWLGRHVIIGSNTVVLPGSRLDEGAAVGAQSLVRGHCEAFTTYSGVPARRIATRKRRLLELEGALLGRRPGG
jgi:dTDP-4-amino-4,6-dideoxy-D-glucose acyltransferase